MLFQMYRFPGESDQISDHIPEILIQQKTVGCEFELQIAIRAGILGFAFGISLYVAITFDNRFKSFGIYGAFLTMFHFSEYFIISVSNPKSLSLDSFMLTHSMQYGLAAVLSWVEYFVELYYVPGKLLLEFLSVELFIQIFKHPRNETI